MSFFHIRQMSKTLGLSQSRPRPLGRPTSHRPGLYTYCQRRCRRQQTEAKQVAVLKSFCRLIVKTLHTLQLTV